MAIQQVNRTDTFETWRLKTNQVSSTLGDAVTLQTTNKVAVQAINEVYNYAQGVQGSVQSVQGSLQGVQNAVQGVQGSVQSLQNLIQGIQTTPGSQGAQGIQGIQGTAGIQGVNGSNGVQGSQGIQGITGAGSQGIQGITGIQGTQGIQGIAGPNTSVNATADSSTTTLYPVMVGATGSVQTVKATTTSGYFAFNASNGSLRISSLGVGTGASGTAGEIRATNNVTAYYSDDRLKTRLGPIENPLDKVMTLSGFYFCPNDTAMALGYQKVVDVGVSAQDVKAILPEIIAPAPIDPKYMTVRYEKLVPLLIEAIKQLKAEVDALKSAK